MLGGVPCSPYTISSYKNDKGWITVENKKIEESHYMMCDPSFKKNRKHTCIYTVIQKSKVWE